MVDKEENIRLKRDIAIKAFEKGCIIRSHTTHTWYTPREFIESNEVVKVEKRGLKDFNNFTLFYPNAAIGKELEDLVMAQEKFSSFMKKISDAFAFQSMEKRKK